MEVAGDAQVGLSDTFEPYLHQIEFDLSELAQRWYPLGQERPIVIDPRRAHSAPVVETGGVRTDLLNSMHSACNSIAAVAAWYGIEDFEVQAAIDFERKIKH